MKRFLRLAAVFAVVAAGASLFFTARNGVETNLLSLVSSNGDGVISASSAMASCGRFLVKADSEEAARERLESLGLQDILDSVRQGVAGEALKALAPYAHGFICPRTAKLLEEGKFSEVRDAAVARLFSPIHPALPLEADPFLLFTEYAMERGGRSGEWVAVDATLTADEAAYALERIMDCPDVRCSGAPFHSALAAENSKREVNALSAVSLACVLAFGWMLARSFRFVPPLLFVLLSSFCVASAVLFAVFGKPHAVTFVFGTTLTGMSVDYVYHALSARKSIARPLAVSFMSTAACFLPLIFSGIPSMEQIAVFTVSGLATAYAAVSLFVKPLPESAPIRDDTGGERNRGNFALRTCAVVLVAVLPWIAGFAGGRLGWFETSSGVDVSRFYRPGKYMLEGERIASGLDGGASFLPDAETQRKNIRLAAKLYDAEGAKYCAMTGLPPSVIKKPDPDKVFDPKGMTEKLFAEWHEGASRMLFVSGAALLLLLVALARKKAIDFIIPVAAAYTATAGLLYCMGEASNVFARICFFLFVGLGIDYSVFCGHGTDPGTARAVRYSFLTSVAGFGLLAFTDFAVTRLMGITLAAGLAVSYFSAKMCAGLSFRVSGRGKPGVGSGSETLGESGAWYDQREQCASGFWMRFMWIAYALFGKTFQKLIFLFAMPVIYLCAVPAKRALGKYYRMLSEYTGREIRPTPMRLFRHILGFAWSLMDKIDANTLRRNLPKMSVRDDDGWRAFRDNAQSGKGAFVLCSHLGAIGVLPALPHALARNGGSVPLRVPKVHAFQQMGHDAVFTKIFMKHFDKSSFELHAVENIGVETAVAMQEAISRGELVIMAGDRTSAGSKGVLKHKFLGKECLWPKGAFRFAKLMNAPVFGIVCARTGMNSYEAHFRRLGEDAPEGISGVESLLCDYVEFLESETVAYPDQWYQFYDFFDGAVL